MNHKLEATGKRLRMYLGKFYELEAEKKRKLYIVLAIAAALGVWWHQDSVEKQGTEKPFILQEESSLLDRDSEKNTENKPKANSEEDAAKASIYVDVSGEVQRPSVVVLKEGSRVFEAIKAAGGETAEADLEQINSAAVVGDGQKLYIPSIQERAYSNGQSTGGKDTLGDQKFSQSNERQSLNHPQQTGAYQLEAAQKINVNTADSTQLQTLKGIGPAMAHRILDYRNAHGGFSSIEELKKVKGIGAKTFEKLQDFIIV